MSRQTWSAGIALAGCLLAASAFADSTASIQVRVGTHPGFGRIVFDLPAHTDYSETRDGQRIAFEFTGNVVVGTAPRLARNVVSMDSGANHAEIVLARGAGLRETRYGNHVVVDVLDPTGAVEASAASGTRPASVAAQPQQQQQQQQQAKPAVSPPQQAKPVIPPPLPAAEPPPQPVAPPATATDAPQPTTDKPPPSELAVSSDTPFGVAAFRRGNAALIVFDRPLTIDLSALHDDKVFGAATVQALPAATIVRIPLAAEAALG